MASYKRFTKLMKRSGSWPLVECLITAAWQEPGEIVQAAVVRESPENGQVVVGGFLIDLGCLGIKNALANRYESIAEYQREYRAQFIASQPMMECDVDLIAKVVDEAVEYAGSLGFKPHKDLKYAKLVMGEANPENCDKEVPVGGEDGQPLFIAGPYDNVKRVLRILDRKVGEGNYNYVVPIDPGF